MILNLQMPVVNLMREIAQLVNTSHFNLPKVSERIQLAIESTVQAAQQVRLPLFFLAQHLCVITVIRCGHVCVWVCGGEREVESYSIISLIFTLHSNDMKRPIFQQLSLMQEHGEGVLCVFVFFLFHLPAQAFAC